VVPGWGEILVVETGFEAVAFRVGDSATVAVAEGAGPPPQPTKNNAAIDANFFPAERTESLRRLPAS
jgi:hypothetical protein